MAAANEWILNVNIILGQEKIPDESDSNFFNMTSLV
jgi:hypothetical protein